MGVEGFPTAAETPLLDKQQKCRRGRLCTVTEGNPWCILRVVSMNQLNGSLYFARAETPGAYSHSKRFTSADVRLDAFQVYKPAPPRMTVRVAHGVSGDGTAAAAFTYFCHCFRPLAAIGIVQTEEY